MCVADDLVVHSVGNTDEEAMQDYDAKLKKLLDICIEKGMKLNDEKMKLRQTAVHFLAKVEATMKMPMPTDVAGAQCLNAFVNY